MPVPGDLDRAATLLCEGQLVAFGTETVYGLGADATNGRAVAEIYRVKGRPSFNPLIVHVPDVASALKLVNIPPELEPLTQLWPGPLTLVAPMRTNTTISDLVTAGLPTLAVRVPENEAARRLLTTCGRPIAAPSANTSGRISPSSAHHVEEDLGGNIAAILDTGPCAVGLESTIVGIGNGEPILLRPGGVPLDCLQDVLSKKIQDRKGEAITAPGQLQSHYAPNAALTKDVDAPRGNDVHIGFGNDGASISLSPTGDLVEAAANLFTVLRQADAIAKSTGARISVAPVPMTGLGVAINDRLTRAAAPRE